MTILSKDSVSSSGESTVQGADSKSSHQIDGGVIGSPPSYADSQAAGPSTVTTEQPRPTNFMSIDRAYGSIKDTWIIDTNIKIPEALLPSLGFFASLRTRPNLALHSASGDIKAAVFLVSSSSNRAIIQAETGSGKVSIQVSRPDSKQPFKLSANTKYGNMIVGLPRDYIGPLKYKTAWGKAKFSAALRPNVVEISGQNGFVGDFEQSGFVDYGAWAKDEVDIETKYGDMSFMYVDEMPANVHDSSNVVEGAMKIALGWLGLS